MIGRDGKEFSILPTRAPLYSERSTVRMFTSRPPRPYRSGRGGPLRPLPYLPGFDHWQMHMLGVGQEHPLLVCEVAMQPFPMPGAQPIEVLIASQGWVQLHREQNQPALPELLVLLRPP